MRKLAVFVVLFSLTAPVRGQAVSPSLPNAQIKPPGGLKENKAFDLDAYFAMPPDEQNAAPLYLDVLLEFSPETAMCFPDSPEIEARKKLALDRKKRCEEIEKFLRTNPRALSEKRVDSLLTDCEPGFRRLAEIQKTRPRCVFASGIAIDSRIPHAQAARQVMRIAALRSRKELARGNLDQPLDDLEIVLRLVRDLRPRGSCMSQLVSAAMTQSAYVQIVLPILGHRQLQARHCDRVIAVITQHEKLSINAFDESLKAEYILLRAALRDAAGTSEKPHAQVAKEARERLANTYLSDLLPAGKTEVDPGKIDDLVRRFETITEVQQSQAIISLNSLYQEMNAMGATPIAQRIKDVNALILDMQKDEPRGNFAIRLLWIMQPVWTTHLQAIGRDQATLHAAVCLAACRRWEITTNTAPVDLAEVVKAAGLARIPIDPYDDRPIRLRRASGRYHVYSVGKDGKDDGGWIDSNYDREPGDLLYRLP